MTNKIIMIVAAILLALGAGYFISQQSDNNEPLTKPPTQNEKENTSSPTGERETLDLTGQQLTALPESAFSNPDVTTLNLSNNQLTSLPADIAKLSNLEILNVENNRLESLPPEISQLTKLREIKANNNRMTSLPGEIGAMTQLKILDVSGNSIPTSQIEELKAQLSNTEIKN